MLKLVDIKQNIAYNRIYGDVNGFDIFLEALIASSGWLLWPL